MHYTKNSTGTKTMTEPLENDENPDHRGDASIAVLEKINQNISELRADLQHLKVAKDEKSDPNHPKKESGKATSRTVLALVFGGLGFKVGSIAGGKLGLLRAMLRKPEEVEKAAEVMTEKYSKYKALIPPGFEHYMKDIIAYGAIGSIAGTAGGALLGWTRGNRIENPGDLLSKPIESFGKILGPEPEKPEAKEDAEKAEDKPTNKIALSEQPVAQANPPHKFSSV